MEDRDIHNITSEQRRKNILAKIEGFTLFDDDFMTKCFEDSNECVELLLRIVMNDESLSIKEVRTQRVIKNLQGRSVRLDLDVTDCDERRYNVEVQRDDRGADEKRARYNSGMLDANEILLGDDIKSLPRTYIIFITEHDVLKGNQPIYHISRCIEECDCKFNDESHIVYVNGACKDDTPLGRLMQDFSCSNPDDMYYKALADRVSYFKKDAKGVKKMCKAVEELCDIERREEKFDTAERMLKDGFLLLDKIVEYSGLTREEVVALKESLIL